MENDRAYVSTNNWIEIIDIQNPTTPSIIATIDEGEMGFDVEDNIIFTTDTNGLIVINATNVNIPEIIGTSDAGNWAYNMRVNNTLVFGIASGDMDIYDISNFRYCSSNDCIITSIYWKDRNATKRKRTWVLWRSCRKILEWNTLEGIVTNVNTNEEVDINLGEITKIYVTKQLVEIGCEVKIYTKQNLEEIIYPEQFVEEVI